MAVKLFGIEISRGEEKNLPKQDIILPSPDDGVATVSGGAYGTFVNQDYKANKGRYNFKDINKKLRISQIKNRDIGYAIKGKVYVLIGKNTKNSGNVAFSTSKDTLDLYKELLENPSKEKYAEISAKISGMDKDFYIDLSTYKNLTYHLILSKETRSWNGRIGYVQDNMINDFQNLTDVVVYACGSSNMISDAKYNLALNGHPPEQFFSDAFVASS